ncbi:GNAT family protein [Viridibacillus sp. FSL R5-0477]|uniref:Acetyltransferase n=1 Tax=Viridibacillus arenosi FSL R5-213 TaxID=1227360 RepID=W4F2D6_9BACL|nr:MULTISPECIES: GNAT family protein [Viridibacillus]ETT86639.1 acetyltransferase [Viridibacillus arenosi FSL R5-213]OMC83541.1 N-acetyltransferase [Viridibacillus sp. FSL H8-0123]OMC89586.1 N-acetyltransferase [Viridibacillus arenosi]
MKVRLKNGNEVTIKEATRNDAQQMINFYNVVGGETDFLSFGKNEFNRDVEEYKKFIDSTSLEQNSIILIATLEDVIIGIASINSSQKDRTKHVGTLGIVVSEQLVGQGLGRILMEELINWATSNGVTKKISLVTREDNTFAIELYEKLGFEKEGLLKKDNFINGVYYNTLVMGLFI